MIKICLLALLFVGAIWPSAAFCQDAGGDAGGDIKLSVIVPDQLSGLNPGQLERLKKKIINIVTDNNFSADGDEQGLVLYPYFQVIDTERVGESGLKALTQVNCSFSLFIKKVTPGSTSQPVINSFVMDCSGGGDNAAQAITNAFQLIRPTNQRLQNFFATSRTKILAYYNQNCEKILGAAQAATSSANYAEAFALLTSIPADAKQCYDELQQKLQSAYLKMQAQDCEIIISKAKAYIAAKQYDSAMAKLQLVDPESTCKDELNQIINELASNGNADEKAKAEALRGASDNKDELAQSRLGNIFKFLKHKNKVDYHIEDGDKGHDAVIVADIPPVATDVKYVDL